MKKAVGNFIIWILPVTTLVLALAGTSHPITWIALGISCVVLITLALAPVVRRLLRRVSERLSSDILINQRIDNLRESIAETSGKMDQLEHVLADGMSQIQESLKKSADVILYNSRSSLGARALFLDRMGRPVYFIHSHRPEEPTHRRVGEFTEWRYTMPPFPIDEADFIPMASQWVLNSSAWLSAAESMPATQDIQILCACGLGKHDPILQCNLILLGSTVFNQGTRAVQAAALKRNWLGYEFCIEPSSTQGTSSHDSLTVYIAGVPAGPYASHVFRPDPEGPQPPNGHKRTDYGLLTRMPNPFSVAAQQPSFIVIVGGCRFSSQVALTEWLSRPATLHRLCAEFEDRPCQCVIKVEYTYRDNMQPLVDKSSVELVSTAVLSIPMPS